MNNTTVGSYMVPLENLPSVKEYDQLSSALVFFKGSLNRGGSCRGPRLVLVKNNSGEPTGILTVKCLLRAAAMRVLENDPLFKSEFFSWHYIKNMRAQGITVREVMRPLDLYTVEYNKNMPAAARLFVRHGISFLPVTEEKKIVGILSARELFYRYYEITRFEADYIYKRKSETGGKLLNEPATV